MPEFSTHSKLKFKCEFTEESAAWRGNVAEIKETDGEREEGNGKKRREREKTSGSSESSVSFNGQTDSDLVLSGHRDSTEAEETAGHKDVRDVPEAPGTGLWSKCKFSSHVSLTHNKSGVDETNSPADQTSRKTSKTPKTHTSEQLERC